MISKVNTNITEYNQNALKEISRNLDFSEYENEPVKIEYRFRDFEDISITLRTLLNAIEFIGFNGQVQDLGTCASLAQIAEKLLPVNELCFLDKLLIKTDETANEFRKI